MLSGICRHTLPSSRASPMKMLSIQRPLPSMLIHTVLRKNVCDTTGGIPLEEVRILDPALCALDGASTSAAVDRLDAHPPHEGPDVDPACFISLHFKLVFHTP